jgi:hypothetical protein
MVAAFDCHFCQGTPMGEIWKFVSFPGKIDDLISVKKRSSNISAFAVAQQGDVGCE